MTFLASQDHPQLAWKTYRCWPNATTPYPIASKLYLYRIEPSIIVPLIFDLEKQMRIRGWIISERMYLNLLTLCGDIT